MALPTFVRDQMLGLDDAARLRQALASGDWWQVTKSSAAIATELGGTLSLVGFPIAAGVGAINRRLGQRAAANAAQYAPVPGVQTVASPQFGFQQTLPFQNLPAPGRTPLPVEAVEPTLPTIPGVSQPGLPFGPAVASAAVSRRTPGLAPGAGIASILGRSSAQAMPTSLLTPTVPVPPRPFAQQAFPGMPEPASAVTREFPPRPEFPLTTRPPLAEVIRRPPGMNPAARGVQPPTNIGPGRVAPPGVRPGLFSMPGIAGGADDALPPLIRNVRGAPRGPRAPRRPEEEQALNLAGRIQRGEAGEMIGRLREGATPPRTDLPEVDVPELTYINLDEGIDARKVSARLLRDAGIRTQQVDQFGNRIDAPMSVDEFFSLPAQEQLAVGNLLEAVRKGPNYRELMRGRQRGVTEPSRLQGMVAQEKYFVIDPVTGKPKTNRMPGTYHGPPGDLERELDEAIRRMDAYQYSTGAVGSGERTGRMVWEGAGGDTKMLRNARLQALDVPPWNFVGDDAGEIVYENGFPLIEESYYINIPGIKKALANATPEQAQWIKTFGARRWHQINSEPNATILTMLKHRVVGGFNGRGYDYGSGIIAVPRNTKAGFGRLERLRIDPNRVSTGTAPTRAGDAKYDLLDFSEANALEDGLINEEFAEIIAKTFRERFRNIEGLIQPRYGIDEAGDTVIVGYRRMTPVEAADRRIARGPRPKPIEGKGRPTGTTWQEIFGEPPKD